MNAVDAVSRGRAQQQRVSARRRHLADSLRASAGRYEAPRFRPCVIHSDAVSARAATTAYTESRWVTQDAWVLRCMKAGTSGASATLSLADPDYVADGTCVWTVLGKLAPIPFANNIAMVKGQQFAAGGMMFEVIGAGTTDASDAAPSTPTGGTHGTVTYGYIGKQELPLVYIAADKPAGTSQQALFSDDSKILAKGGVKVDGYPYNNSNGTIKSQSWDGATLNRGHGSWLFQTDAPLFGLRGYTQIYEDQIWVDGKFVATVYAPVAAAFRAVAVDCTGLSRKMRNIRHKSTSGASYMGVWATGFDTVRAWDGYSPLRAILISDSFTEGYSYSDYLSEMLGVEDWWWGGVGSTGILTSFSGKESWTTRLTFDVISRNPDLVVIALSRNDTAGAAVTAAFEAMIDRIRNETQAEILVVGLWNNRAPLTSGADYDQDLAYEACCAARGVPFIKWRDLLTDGGYVGAASSTGNSKYYTTYDGTHPTTPAGAHFRASFLAPRFIEALEGLALDA